MIRCGKCFSSEILQKVSTMLNPNDPELEWGTIPIDNVEWESFLWCPDCEDQTTLTIEPMTIDDLKQQVDKLIANGYGNLEVFYLASNPTVSGPVTGLSHEPIQKSSEDVLDQLCKKEDGFKYIGIFLG